MSGSSPGLPRRPRDVIHGRRMTTAAINKREACFVRLAFTLYATGNYSLTELRKVLTKKGFERRSARRVAWLLPTRP
jgi:hypothetical protein